MAAAAARISATFRLARVAAETSEREAVGAVEGGVGGGGGYDIGDDSGGGGGFGGGGGGNGSGGFGGGTGNTEYNSYGGSSRGSGAGMGGAIFNHGGTLSITNSTLTANTATGGGGEFAYGGASGFGGAIFNLNGAVTLEFCTVDANTVATGLSPGIANSAAGGAVYSVGYNLIGGQAAALTIWNSILADSVGGSDLVSDQPSNVASAAGGGANVATASVTYAGANIVMSSSIGSSALTGPAPLDGESATLTAGPQRSGAHPDHGHLDRQSRSGRGRLRPQCHYRPARRLTATRLGLRHRRLPVEATDPGHYLGESFPDRLWHGAERSTIRTLPPTLRVPSLTRPRPGLCPAWVRRRWA